MFLVVDYTGEVYYVVREWNAADKKNAEMTTRGSHTPSNSHHDNRHHDNQIYTNNMAYSSTSTSSHSSSSRSGGAAHRAVALDLMLRTFMNSPEFQPYNPRMWEGISKLVPGTTPHQVSSLNPVMKLLSSFYAVYSEVGGA